MLRKEDVNRVWHLADAKGKTLGRLATEIATLLMGKRKTTYTPHIDGGDFVVVINADKISVTGKKLKNKIYYRHSNYPGGLKARPLDEMLRVRPLDVLKLAVKRMLPKNTLGHNMLSRLKLYVGEEHSHIAQNPIKFEIK